MLGKNFTVSSFVDSFTNMGMGTLSAFKDEGRTSKGEGDNIHKVSAFTTS